MKRKDDNMDYQQNIIVNKLPDEGLVSVKQFVNYTYTDKKTNKIVKVIGALAMSKSKFLQGVKDGIFREGILKSIISIDLIEHYKILNIINTPKNTPSNVNLLPSVSVLLLISLLKALLAYKRKRYKEKIILKFCGSFHGWGRCRSFNPRQ